MSDKITNEWQIELLRNELASLRDELTSLRKEFMQFTTRSQNSLPYGFNALWHARNGR